MVKDYEIRDNHVVLILHDNIRVTVRPDQLSGGKSAYQKLLFLLYRMHTNDVALDIVNNLVAKLIN